MTDYQRTLKKAFKLSGIGLHKGKKVTIRAKPAPVNTGITFKRVDLTPHVKITAHISSVQITELSTTLVSGSTKIATIEHLMAAFYACEVDNALIEIDSEEVPILDGSSKDFFDEIESVGSEEQNELRQSLNLNRYTSITEQDKIIEFKPHKEKTLIIDYCISFPQSQIIGKQNFKFELTKENFKEICSARTFCRLEDVKFMQERGLALGGSLDNAIVVDREKVLNHDGLRFEKEFVKHKILDCLGDISLLGHRFYGHIKVFKGGHALHHKLTQALL